MEEARQLDQLENSHPYLVPKKRKRVTLTESNGASDDNDSGQIEYKLKKKVINSKYESKLEKINKWREKKLNKLKRSHFFHQRDDQDESAVVPESNSRDEIINENIEFYFYHKTQFLLNNGRSSCAGISLTLIWNYLRDNSLPVLEFNYGLIIDSGICAWLKWKEESNSSENFVNIHTIIELKLFEKVRTKLTIIKEIGGSLIDKLNHTFAENYSDATKRVGWAIPDALSSMCLDYPNKRIAGSLTLKDYTITLLKEKKSTEIYLFDSHGIGEQLIQFGCTRITNYQRDKSVLIKFSLIDNLIHYIRIRYPSEKPLHFPNGHIKQEEEDDDETRTSSFNFYENTYSLILFELT